MKTLNIKKALSALLVMLMLTFAVAVPAFAAGPDDQPAETAASQIKRENLVSFFSICALR